MITLQQFRKLKELQLIGISQEEINVKLGITKYIIKKWWRKTEEEFMAAEALKTPHLDQYRQLLVGKSGLSKTAIAVHLANVAIDKGYKAMYLTVDELLIVLKSKDTYPKAKLTHGRIVAADVLVLDDFLYLDLPKDDLELIYKTLMMLSGGASIVFIANREPIEWVNSAEDKYTTQLLINRAIASCEKMLL